MRSGAGTWLSCGLLLFAAGCDPAERGGSARQALVLTRSVSAAELSSAASTGVVRSDAGVARAELGSGLRWTAGPALNLARADHGVAAFAGSVYVVGGCAVGDGTGCTTETATTEVLVDPSGGGWQLGAPLPAGRARVAAAAANGFLFVAGGASGGALSDEILAAPLLADAGVGPFALAARLGTARAGAAAVVQHGFLYVLGGEGATGPLGDGEAFRIDPGGALAPAGAAASGLSAWEALAATGYDQSVLVVGGRSDGGVAGSLWGRVGASGALSLSPTGTDAGAVSGPALAAAAGHLFRIGGRRGGASVSEVAVAPIFGSGGLGTWRLTTPLSAPLSGAAAAVDGDLVIVPGGYSGGATSAQVWLGRVEPSGPTTGELAPPLALTPLPSARQYLNIQLTGDEAWFIGGCSSLNPQGYCIQGLPDVLGRGLPPGTPADAGYRAAPPLPVGTFSAATLHEGGQLYLFGGGTMLNNLSTQVIARPLPATADGGSWSNAGPPLSEGITGAVALSSDDKVYLIGGYTSAMTAKVEVGPVLEDGGLGSFSATTPMTAARTDHAAFVHGRRIVVVAGWDGAPRSDLITAPLLADGGVGAWQFLQNLPSPSAGLRAVTRQGYAWLTGGGSSAPSSEVLAAGLLPDGGLGSLTVAGAMLEARFRHAVAASGSGLVTGGGLIPPNTAVASVDFIPFRLPVARGRIELETDLGAEVNVTAMRIDGSSAGGVVSLAYRLAPPDGGYGAWTEVGPVPLGATVPIQAQPARTVQWSVALDDEGVPRDTVDAPFGTVLSGLEITYDTEVGVPDAGLDGGLAGDGGLDAGSPDGGVQDGGPQVDGGPDGGGDGGAVTDGGFQLDGGSGGGSGAGEGADGGGADAGPAEPRVRADLEVGCGCASASSGSWLLLLLAAPLLRRRRAGS